MKTMSWLDSTYAMGSLFLLTLGVCTMMLHESQPPEVRQVLVASPLDSTYARAQRAAYRMGATIVSQDPLQRTFAAHVKNIIGLHVDVRRVEAGTQLTITSSVLPKTHGVGINTEADDFLRAYREEPL